MEGMWQQQGRCSPHSMETPSGLEEGAGPREVLGVHEVWTDGVAAPSRGWTLLLPHRL